MNKDFIFIECLLLCFLLGCKSVVQKEDLIFQARQIKGSEPGKSLKPFVSDFSSLPNKEKLVYKATFLGLSIGKFIIMNNGKRMLNGQEVYCFELTVKTLPFFSILFKTKNRYVSYMDAQKLVILRHEEYIKGGTFLESAVDFDYNFYTAKYKNFIDQKEIVVKIPDKLLDVLSGIYYLRMLPLELGDTVDINIYADQKIYNYTGFLSAKTEVNLPNYGKQEAYCFEPYLFLDGTQIKNISAETFFSTANPSKTLRATLKTLLGNVNVLLMKGY
ncbi:MAG: hypothetical protein A2243_09365 [Omnitrophica WOR_2 bacterium RIFOXYA2_FULL_38_17]|nr:MAG: hypothetical protein A2243_09365 [Omnitrophica WOR_2 bacterium RIFOXYA2_FULL_38_17]OGX58282.1 MAG: hypothetical protein A2447_02450 [Omnitrophica WOR_2 bacterium RIFOXYC2_FULL_38_12]